MTLSGTASRVRARVVPGSGDDDADEHGQGDDAAGVAEHGDRREQRGEDGGEHGPRGGAGSARPSHMSSPTASIVRATARPTLRSGQVSAAHAPMPSAASTASGCGGRDRSGQTPASVPGPPPVAAGAVVGVAGAVGCGRGRVQRGRPWGGAGRGGWVGMVRSSVRWVGSGRSGCAGAARRAGRRRSLPSVVGRAVIVPPCSSQTQRAMARPRPVPPPESSPDAEPVEDALDPVGRDAGALVAHLEPPGGRRRRGSGRR